MWHIQNGFKYRCQECKLINTMFCIYTFQLIRPAPLLLLLCARNLDFRTVMCVFSLCFGLIYFDFPYFVFSMLFSISVSLGFAWYCGSVLCMWLLIHLQGVLYVLLPLEWLREYILLHLKGSRDCAFLKSVVVEIEYVVGFGCVICTFLNIINEKSLCLPLVGNLNSSVLFLNTYAALAVNLYLHELRDSCIQQ